MIAKIFRGSLIVLLVALASISQAMTVTFQGLGDLPGGDFYSQATGVSDDGSTVVGYSGSALAPAEAFRWTQGPGMQPLGFLVEGSFDSRSTAVSADGSVVVGSSRSASGQEAFRWTVGPGMQGLGDLSGGSFNSVARTVSGDGTIVAGEGSVASGWEAFRWTQPGPMQGLGFLTGGSVSFASGISADGSVIAGYGDSADGVRAFRLSGPVMDPLAPGFGMDYSRAWAVSADGSTIVGFSGEQSPQIQEAFLWIGLTPNPLGDLPGGSTTSQALDVSGNGAIVVGFATSESGQEAFIWDSENNMRSLKDVLEGQYGLNLTGWTLTDATGISANGLTIVGNGTSPTGNTEAWMVTIPEPMSLLLLGTGGLVLLKKRRS
jgi:probable HAF family extracellular repeat protein